MECLICFQKINKVNINLQCNYCENFFCKNCLKQWILSSKNLECLHCKNNFTFQFIYETLGKSFIDFYKKIQIENIFKIEENFIKETIIFLNYEDKFYYYKNKYQHYENLLKNCKSTEYKILKNKYHCLDIFANDKFTKTKLLIYLQSLKDKYYQKYICYYKAFIKGDKSILEKLESVEHLDKIKSICNCHQPECKGFILSNDYKCNICCLEICKICLEIKNINHECNIDIIKNIEIIDKDSKPCPKCFSRISKVDGCFARNTLIPLYNKNIKFIQDIVVNDELIGDDYKPRKVLKILKGIDDLYKITQQDGIEYIVNKYHTLCLMYKNETITLTIDQYLLLSDNQKRQLFGYKSFPDNYLKNIIKVEYFQRGEYFGFTLDQNQKFLLTDLTVVKNCDQMFCVNCDTAFSWKTNEIENGRIHNPHYYDKIRSRGIELNPIQNYENIDDNIDDELLSQLCNEIIYKFGVLSEYRLIIDNFIEMLLNYLHNLHMYYLYDQLNYNFQSNYHNRLLYLKNKIDINKFKKSCYKNYLLYQLKKEVLTLIQISNQKAKIDLIKTIKLYMTIYEDININKEEMINQIHQVYLNNKKELTEIKNKLIVINKAYNNTQFLKLFVI